MGPPPNTFSNPISQNVNAPTNLQNFLAPTQTAINQCFVCQGTDHYARDCPQSRVPRNPNTNPKVVELTPEDRGIKIIQFCLVLGHMAFGISLPFLRSWREVVIRGVRGLATTTRMAPNPVDMIKPFLEWATTLNEATQAALIDKTTLIQLISKTLLDKLENAYQIVKARVRIIQEQSKKQYDLRSRPLTLNIGQLVWVTTHVQSFAKKPTSHKLYPKYEGPYLIAKRLNNLAYDLKDPGTGEQIGISHIRQLKLVYERLWPERETGAPFNGPQPLFASQGNLGPLIQKPTRKRKRQKRRKSTPRVPISTQDFKVLLTVLSKICFFSLKFFFP